MAPFRNMCLLNVLVKKCHKYAIKVRTCFSLTNFGLDVSAVLKGCPNTSQALQNILALKDISASWENTEMCDMKP